MTNFNLVCQILNNQFRCQDKTQVRILSCIDIFYWNYLMYSKKKKKKKTIFYFNKKAIKSRKINQYL